MSIPGFYRRVIPLAAAGFAAGCISTSSIRANAQGATSTGYVLGSSEGEHLIQRGGNIFIKVQPDRGSSNLAVGTQQVLAGVGIPVHRHLDMDEAFYVIDGSGTLVLNDTPHPIQKGDSIFIPKNAWHGFQNPNSELLLLWIAVPPHLAAFFREFAARPGAPPVQRTKDQMNELARKYGTEFR
jgi:quercetin dioxygenase-like cupin family protein